MHKIVFEDKELEIVNVEDVPKEMKSNLDKLQLVAGNCLHNSYLFAKSNTGVKVVEGFLVTYFESDLPECVAHVWNVFGEKYFDISISLIKHDKNIRSNKYYIAEVYSIDQAKKEQRINYKSGLSSFFEQEHETYLIFKSSVKTLEDEIKNILRKTHKENLDQNNNDA